VPGTICGLVEQGFHAVATANNHILDYGVPGFCETIAELDKQGVQHVGAGMTRDKAYQPLIITLNGITVGIVNGCESHNGVHDSCTRSQSPGYAWLLAEEFRRTIEACAKSCHVVIVLAHAGLEHHSIPQPEWRAVYRSYCDLGADAVVGSHPHVPQGCEIYRGKPIFYSVGNFYFDTLGYEHTTDDTYSVVFEVSDAGVASWDVVYTHKSPEYLVEMIDTPRFADIDALNSLLGEDYARAADAMSAVAYQSLKPLMQRCITGWYAQTSLRAMARNLASRMLGRSRRPDKPVVLHHLLRNESYRFAMQHALRLEMSSHPTDSV